VDGKRDCIYCKARPNPLSFAGIVLILLLNQAALCMAAKSHDSSTQCASISADSSIEVGGSCLRIDLEGAEPDLPKATIEQYIRNAAQAVAVYYGHFPVPSARIVVNVSPGQSGILQGTTWGDVDGFPAVTRLRLGQHTTEEQLSRDWIATHELVHMSLASLPDAQHWLEEGIATYVEPIARVQAGQLTPERIWGDMVAGMRNGEPREGDRGLDRTHTWGRTYWGGALFCLIADIEIRKQTDNASGLQDALRAIVAAGGTIDKDWPISRILAIGDRETGTSTLHDLYTSWSTAPVAVDLQDLWGQLGVQVEGGEVTLNNSAPLARLRVSITAVLHNK
jgi:hypothetical protein